MFLKSILISSETKKYENRFHEFHRSITRWFIAYPFETSCFLRGFISFTLKILWNLWSLVKAPKFHTEVLINNKLSFCETNERFFKTFIFPNGIEIQRLGWCLAVVHYSVSVVCSRFWNSNGCLVLYKG